ncbi:MAG TPA: BMP family ABC transporter substrate-binding protein [Anaerolineaceae bacterium]|mgnify:FL=1|nr:BMP family ABC transporter substrate-binding protein [Anaerolineaceae bacterium]HOR84524.1 BMP family ABC transporter substrate-binding protein [Anaerolineaceae bacterium]HPL42523.1 BMP family ABC transporter substrate-binding protein [Anaerolineaceae bacterium]
MKKVVLFLLVAILALSMVGCAQKAAEPEKPAEPGQAAGKVYKVVSLVNGNLGDKSFFDSAESGLKELAAAGRIEYKTIEMGGTDQDQPKWLETLNEVASSGEYDLVICGTYQMPDYLKEAATTYPNQKFLIYDDNTYVGVNQNVVNITYKQNDMGYLIGTFAAKMTTETSVDKINPEAVVGFIGGIDSPVINDFLYGFLEGAKAANPDIKVDTRYVNSYVDTATAKEIGLSMINDKKADILWGVAGLSGNGGAEAALESGKAWFIGVDSDQELTLPAAQAAITLTSGLKNVGKSIIWLFDEWDAGRTYWGQEVRLGIPEGGVGVVTDKNFAKIAPKAIQDAVLAAQADIVAGKIVVPTAIGDTTNAVVTLRDAMQP